MISNKLTIDNATDVLRQVSQGISYVIFPGKYVLDKTVIESDFNQKHKVVGYNPLEYWFTPFDVTPVGALSKFNKGYKAYKGGRNMISMGISGFGKTHKNKGVQDMLVGVLSKVYDGLGPSVIDVLSGDRYRNKTPPVPKPVKYEQSRVGRSLTSKPMTRGKLVKPQWSKYASACPPGS